ncbi:lysosomal cobalamin transporter ABCD4-like [Diadema setosum]|uniref:lysosomal cobalamin transporter ABCD4-like n=1 Tax=Diadema setosum TaxID=31175 RepID=UPI003B3B914D
MLFLNRFLHLVPILFRSCQSAQTGLFLLLLLVAGGEQVAAYFVGLIPSHFYVVLPAQDWHGFITTLWQSLLYIILIALIKSTKTYISKLLYVKWRGSLTSHLHSLYFRAFNYYKLNVLQIGNIDNTDQRISQDVERLCNQLNLVVPTLIVSPFTIATYTYLTYQITGYLGPVVIYSYFIVGSIINRFIMSPVVNLTYQQEKREGIFRFKHAQLRANSESVAFYSAGQAEADNADRKLWDLLGIQINLTNWEFWLNVAVNLFDYIGGILSYIIIAIPIFAGIYSGLPATEISSLISKYSFQTMYLISCFSQIIDLSNKISDIAGYTHRIGELLESLESFPPEGGSAERSTSSPPKTSGALHLGADNDLHLVTDTQFLITETERDREYMSEDHGLAGEEGEESSSVDSLIAFQLDQVAVATPTKDDILIKDLTLEVVEGRNILITGATGSGKTSLLRVLHGIWPVQEGSVEQRGVGPLDVMFLPQKAYLTDGTLLEQIMYPTRAPRYGTVGPDQEQLLGQILDQVGLEGLVQRCGGLTAPVSWNWYDVLTPGEAQCLAFARLLHHRPKFALLDEATSAVPVEREAQLYALCRQYGMTVVSVGHHITLKRFHDAELTLTGQGGWTLVDISHIE